MLENLKESVLGTCLCVELFFYSKGLQVLKNLKVNFGKEVKIFGHFSDVIQLAAKRPRHMTCHLTFPINISSIYWTSCQYVIWPNRKGFITNRTKSLPVPHHHHLLIILISMLSAQDLLSVCNLAPMLISMLGPPLHLHTLRDPVQTRYALMR